MTDTVKAQEGANLSRIGDISFNIRNAVRSALPTPPEQFLTLMVPGKVVNFGRCILCLCCLAIYLRCFVDDYKVDDASNAILPLKTELNQAILCDDMPTFSTLQMGPTGKSVARSYANAIGKLVSAGKCSYLLTNTTTLMHPGQVLPLGSTMLTRCPMISGVTNKA